MSIYYCYFFELLEVKQLLRKATELQESRWCILIFLFIIAGFNKSKFYYHFNSHRKLLGQYKMKSKNAL